MDRAEKAGLGIAIAGHAALFGLLSVGFLATPNPANLKQKPIEVTLTDEIALESTAPNPAEEAPKALSPDPTPLNLPEPEAQPTPPAPTPEPQPVARPKPVQAKPSPQPKPAPAKPRPTPPPTAKPATQAPQRKSRLDADFGENLRRGTRSETSATTGAPAQKAGQAEQAALESELRRQLKPHWTAPTGADAEKLKTEVCFTLGRDGKLASIDSSNTTGDTPSNRSQAQLHKERAIKAVRLASPFRFPLKFYDEWQTMCPTFDRRL